MSRRYRSESIVMVTGEEGQPAAFRWRGRRYEVRAVVTSWVEALPWWVEQGCGQRHVWRVEAATRTGSTGVYDLYRIAHGQGWRWGLDRVID